MVLNIRPLDTRSRADEAAGLEMIARTQACFGKRPLQTNLELAPRVQMSVDSNGLGAPVLKIDLQVIGEVFTDTGELMNHRNTRI